MIKSGNRPIAVCSWSLKNDFDKINQLKEQTDLNHLHLAVGPALERGGDAYLDKIIAEGWEIAAGMIDFPQEDYSSLEAIKVTGGIVPENEWPGNKSRVFDALDIAAELSIEYLSFHFGFIEMQDSKQCNKLQDRALTLAERAAEKDILLLMETGQESAEELKRFLELLDNSAFAVNFDPANMILYDKGDPIEAVNILGSWIKNVHIKDANRTQVHGTWGEEVPWTKGQVGQANFLGALDKINYSGALAIEREAGDDRLGDIKLAIDKLISFEG